MRSAGGNVCDIEKGACGAAISTLKCVFSGLRENHFLKIRFFENHFLKIRTFCITKFQNQHLN